MTQKRDHQVEIQTTEGEMPTPETQAPSLEQQAKEREKQEALKKTQADIQALNLDWGSQIDQNVMQPMMEQILSGTDVSEALQTASDTLDGIIAEK